MSEIDDLRSVSNYLERECKRLREEVTALRADKRRLHTDNERLRAELRRLGLQFDDHDLNRRT